MPWSFALVNNRLAEIYFEQGKSGLPEIKGHCYVQEKEFSTKQEKRWIREDTKKYQFSYRKRLYRDKLRNITLKSKKSDFSKKKN